MIELRPCPFCANDGTGPIEDALHVSHTQNDWHQFYDCYSVQCDKCTATMGFSESEEAAIEAWNTRSHSTMNGECQDCDEGRIWNNADPTSGQWVECESCCVAEALGRDAELVAEVVAQRCSTGTKKNGSPKAPHRYAIIWQAARLGAIEYARMTKGDVA